MAYRLDIADEQICTLFRTLCDTHNLDATQCTHYYLLHNTAQVLTWEAKSHSLRQVGNSIRLQSCFAFNQKTNLFFVLSLFSDCITRSLFHHLPLPRTISLSFHLTSSLYISHPFSSYGFVDNHNNFDVSTSVSNWLELKCNSDSIAPTNPLFNNGLCLPLAEKKQYLRKRFCNSMLISTAATGAGDVAGCVAAGAAAKFDGF